MRRFRQWLQRLHERWLGVEEVEVIDNDDSASVLASYHATPAEDPAPAGRIEPSDPPVWYAETWNGQGWSPRTFHGGRPSTAGGRLRTSEGAGASVRNVGLLPAQFVGLDLTALQAKLAASDYAFAEVPAPAFKPSEVARAVIEHERLGLIAGRVVDRHADGTVTIDYAGLLRLTGRPQEVNHAAS